MQITVLSIQITGQEASGSDISVLAIIIRRRSAQHLYKNIPNPLVEDVLFDVETTFSKRIKSNVKIREIS